MSYGMVGAGRHSTRIAKAKELRLKAYRLMGETSHLDPKYARRLKRYRKIDAIYGQVHVNVNNGLSSPEYFKNKS